MLVTAADAYMRDLELYIPGDCTASISSAENRRALQYMQRVLHANTTPSTKLDLGKLSGRKARVPGRSRKRAKLRSGHK